MKNQTIILITVFLLISCRFSGKESIEKEAKQTKEKIDVPTSDSREMYHLLLVTYPERGATKWELQAFYTDGSIVNYTGNLTGASINEINNIIPDKARYTEVAGKLVCYSDNGELFIERDLSKRVDIVQTGNFWKRYEWAMISGKWLIRPEGMMIDKDFKETPQSGTPSLVSVLLDGYCSYEKIVIDTTGWYQLSYLPEQREFEIVNANISLDQFYWDCGDMDMYRATSNAENAVLLFKGLKTSTGLVNSHFHKITCAAPGDDYIFSFNGINYTLRAEGILSPNYSSTEEYEREDGRRETGNVYQEYKLYLESDGISQLVLAIDNFSDKYVTMEFVGDLDGDGKPDFVFETATWYEDYEKMLFLSSFADEGELVKYAGRNGYSMAC